MGYFMLLLATLAWSFVGVLVKTASTMVDSSIITFARFFFGVLFLGIFLLWRDGRLDIRAGLKWIWLGAFGKSLNYLLENLALTIGYSYGNILVMPAQTVALLLAARFLFKEEVTAKGWTAAALCMMGVLIIGWNGTPAAELLTGGGLTTVLFTLSGIGAAIHVLSQRQLVKVMDNGSMNLSVFLFSTLIVAVPMPLQEHAFSGNVTIWAWGALVLLGLITGLSFFWFAEALKRVPFMLAAVVSNCSVLFTILWSRLFYHEPITGYVICGALVFLAGFLLLNLPARRSQTS